MASYCKNISSFHDTRYLLFAILCPLTISGCTPAFLTSLCDFQNMFLFN